MVEVFHPRPAQKDILSYRSGTMGVSAVPGSGKTWTLSYLAAELIRNKCITADQEVLVVTLVNSAVDNFSKRISQFLQEFGLIPSLGYRVRTLHGLAHDIVNERPELAGLDNGFQIIDEAEATRVREDAVFTWMKKNTSVIEEFLIADLSESKISNLRQKQIPALLNQIALQFIRTSKNLGLVPSAVIEHSTIPAPVLPLVKFGAAIYSDYQRSLAFRGAVDFDDLIIKAHQILTLDESLLHRLQRTWPYILEDESQDSSLLQQKILSLLSTQSNSTNWVRVGDPNQAIYESFTTADPRLLIDFISQADKNYTLPNSGRSTEAIMRLANTLVDWSINDHPNPRARSALYPNYILPTPSGDIQPNPDNLAGQIHLYDKALDPEEELQLIAQSVSKWLEKHPDATAAILAPRNERGKKMASVLRDDYNVEPVELLNSSLATRKTIGALANIIACLIAPLSSKKLSSAFLVYHRGKRVFPEQWVLIEELANTLKKITKPETFLSPILGEDWLEEIPDHSLPINELYNDFRGAMLVWQNAVQLPIDQLILTISLEIFSDPSSISLAHRLATHEKQLSNSHPDWGLQEYLDDLRALARNERRFLFDGNSQQFNPDAHKGKVVVTTAHKSKGLEWDRVYLISANNYNFPSGSDGDEFISERWFIRDNLNLPAEILAYLDHLKYQQSLPSPGVASSAARNEYIRERLRLFYVSITRARKDLIITWNTGRTGKSSPCKAFEALVERSSSKEEM